MRTQSNTSTNTSVNAVSEVTRFSLGIGISAAALVAIWSVACLISVIDANGVSGTISSLLSAFTG